MSKTGAQVSIDLGERIATVDRNIGEKYARKLLQDALKTETLFKGGWYCYLMNADMEEGDGTRPHYYKGTYSGNGVQDHEHYVFELSNRFAEAAGYI